MVSKNIELRPVSVNTERADWPPSGEDLCTLSMGSIFLSRYHFLMKSWISFLDFGLSKQNRVSLPQFRQTAIATQEKVAKKRLTEAFSLANNSKI